MNNQIYNPWFDLNNDLIWIRNNIPLILRFIVENTVRAISLLVTDEVDGIHGNITELYIFDPLNWKEAGYQVITGVIGAPILLFSLALVTIVSFPSFVLQIFCILVIPLVAPLPLLYIAACELILLYFLLRILQSFEIQQTPRPPINRDSIQSFFINGICVNKYWAQQNCRRIMLRLPQARVGTVTPIPNPSYGLMADLFESIVMRNFRVNSTAVCIATDTIERTLRASETKIVRLISHSQGTIIANLAVQKLYYNLSLTGDETLLRKLHVHTFACAARNFTNPEGLLGCLEHYMNRDDPIVLLGISRDPKTGRYDGNRFVNNEGYGHLFNRYYSLYESNYTFLPPDEASVPGMSSPTPELLAPFDNLDHDLLS